VGLLQHRTATEQQVQSIIYDCLRLHSFYGLLQHEPTVKQTAGPAEPSVIVAKLLADDTIERVVINAGVS
jgi:hypothetical protein